MQNYFLYYFIMYCKCKIKIHRSDKYNDSSKVNYFEAQLQMGNVFRILLKFEYCARHHRRAVCSVSSAHRYWRMRIQTTEIQMNDSQ